MLKQLEIGRLNKILLTGALIIVILYFGKKILVPATFSIFFAMLMTPVSDILERRKIPRLLSSLVSVLIIISVLTGVLSIIYIQASEILNDLPLIKTRLENSIHLASHWMKRNLDIRSGQIEVFLSGKVSEFVIAAGRTLSGLILNIFTLASGTIAILILTLLLLYNREKYHEFTLRLFRPEKRDKAKTLISKISGITQQYLGGRVVAIIILSILFAIGFLLTGLKNALLVSIITGLVSIIPYIGPLLGGLVPLLVVLIYGSFDQAIAVVTVVLVINAIDNYFIEPFVSGETVSINAFFTFVSLLAGFKLWGIAGAILFLPLVGIVKIIFDNVETLHPYSYLISDQKKSSSKLFSRIRDMFRRDE
jgi:predicted PurR-regulated permease PerM